MIRILYFITALFVTSSALAQQPSPSQTAIQIDNVINSWAQQLEAKDRLIAELKTKCGKPCKDKEEK